MNVDGLFLGVEEVVNFNVWISVSLVLVRTATGSSNPSVEVGCQVWVLR